MGTIVQAAVQQDGKALQYASEEMKNNGAIVQAAVEQYGGALEYASKEMMNNVAMLSAAFQQMGKNITAEDIKSKPLYGIWQPSTGSQVWIPHRHDSTLEVTSQTSCKWQGCTGELKSEGKLYWSDNDVWTVSVSHSFRSHRLK